MLVFLRLRGSGSILATAPCKSCLVLKAAMMTNRKSESIPDHGSPFAVVLNPLLAVFAGIKRLLDLSKEI